MASILEQSLSTKDTKPFWRYVKSKRQDNTGISPLKRAGQLVSDSTEQAEILNSQFRSVFTEEDLQNLPSMPGTPHQNAEDIDIQVSGVEKLLQNLKPGKASGPDAIPNRLLICGATELAPMLTAIFRQSLNTGTLPEDWRTAYVTPIFKKGSRHLPENYRPVSLTSVPCKLLEHIVTKHVLAHFERNNILSNLQHGFRGGHSCETQLLVTMQDVLSRIDTNVQVDIAILDFSKAFDVVPHQRLLSKLSHYGVRGLTRGWIEAFLSNRTQHVLVNGEMSTAVPVTSGVPQGTVLGPLLFLCYINDLPLVTRSQVRLFADDCLLYRSINDERDHQLLQEDLNSLEQWASTWQMKFNPKKCYIMKIHRSRTCKGGDYTFCDSTLEQVKNSPYLGVVISDDAKWGEHINKSVKKANSTLGFIRRNLRQCPRDLKELAYNSLVRSILEYACVVWDPHLAKDTKHLEAVQRRAARFVCRDYERYSSVSAMLKTLGWISLQARRRHARLTMMHKIMHHRVAVDATHLVPAPGRTRASHHLKIQHLATNCTPYRQSFFPRTIPEWNILPQELVDCGSPETFRARLTLLD